MKFIHTGDIHWGMSPDSDKPWSRERSRDIRDTFTAIIARQRNCAWTACSSRGICSTASRCCAT